MFQKLLQNKYLIAYGVLLLLLILFHTPIESIFYKTIVVHVLSHVDSVLINDLLIGSVFLYAITVSIVRFKNRYVPSTQITLLLLIVTAIYSFYRFYSTSWEFTPFWILNQIKYLDVLLVIAFCNFILLVRENKELENTNNSNTFFDDDPLGTDNKDALGYTNYATTIADKVKASYFKKAFAIGINGKWGLGKTSFIDLLKRNLKSKDIIEVNFNPWNSSNPKAIIQDFFDTLQVEISPYHSSLSNQLRSYSGKLVALNDNTLSQSILASVSAITGFESINNLYEEINRSLEKISKKLIIYIDDLDRLDKEEIIEVIRLIRNTANFHNTFFIVAYDRNYVVNALQGHNTHNHEMFLDKIFQVEVTLPYFNRDIFRYKLVDFLKSKFPQEHHDLLDSKIIGSTVSAPTYLNDWLESMRDVSRLANALCLNLQKLLGEVEISDILRLELLRIKYPSVYELLFKKTDDFLETNANNQPVTYQIKNVDHTKHDFGAEYKNIESFLEIYLMQNFAKLSVPKHDIKKITHLISGIFPSGLTFSLTSRSNLSVIYPSKFLRYFAYNLVEGNLSEIDFSKARDLNKVDFLQKIDEWVQKGLETEVKKRIIEIKDFDNLDDFEKIITAIFYLANLKTQIPGRNSNSIIGYEYNDLSNKLYTKKVVTKYYQGKKANYRRFVKLLFEMAKSPYEFESDLVRAFNKNFSDDFILPKDQLKDLAIRYFVNYLSATNKLDDNIWKLYHNTKQTEWINTGGNSYQEKMFFPRESNRLFIKFVLTNDLNNFILAVIQPETFYQKTYFISDFVLKTFDSWDNFKTIIFHQSEERWSYLKEFKDLFSLIESNGFSKYVKFNFNVIPIQRKFRGEI